MRRNALQVTELKNSHAQCDADFFVKFLFGAAGEVADQEIELGLISKAAEDDSFREPRVARGKRCAELLKQIGCKRTRAYLQKDAECNFTSGSSGGHNAAIEMAAIRITLAPFGASEDLAK